MPSPQTIRFDSWVLHREVGDLIRGEEKIRLQDQPLQVLNELLEHPGELVTREQLIARLWPKGVVDYDTGINSAVRKLRVALRDTGDTPRYIETVPRKGYRFIGRIDAPDSLSAQSPSPPGVAIPTPVPEQAPPPPRRRHTYIYVVLGVLAVAATGSFFWRERPVTDSAAIAPSSRMTGSPELSLVVLPLQTLANDEPNALLSSSVTDLLRDRLARFPGLIVVSNHSASNLGTIAADSLAAGRKLRSRFVVHGRIARHGEQLQLALELTDTNPGTPLWSSSFERPAADLAALREEVAGHIAHALHLPAATPGPTSPVNLEAYQLYVRGQRLMANMNGPDAEQAAALFRRATVLDPAFARAYLASGQAILLASRLNGVLDTPELTARVEKNYDRALQMDPALGEVWVERARLVQDRNRAEPMYLKGLALSPSYGVGYMRYSEMLMGQGRFPEAIEVVDRARRIDPLTPHVHSRKAFLMLVQSSDVQGHEALLREALEINPKFQMALLQLADSRHMWSGEFAEAVSLAERAITLDTGAEFARAVAATIYLDLDDPEAAMHVLRGVRTRSSADVDIAKYRNDRRSAADIAYGLAESEGWSMHGFSPLGEAIRDAALQSGDFTRAVQLLESKYAIGTGAIMSRRGVVAVYADALARSGDPERAARVARSLLVVLDAEEVGRPKHWFSRERASMLAILGEPAKSIDVLAEGQGMHQFARWWYTAELDPLFENARRDPRFLALAERAKRHRAQQRALLEEMRNKGAVPRRTG